jgi:uncharacterized protein
VSDFLTALGLVFAIEGLLFAAFPGAMRRAMAAVALSPETFLRYSGLASAAIGVAIVFVVRLLSG